MEAVNSLRMKRVWNFFASIWLTIVLAVLICLVSAWGSILSMKNSRFFGAMDQVVLFPWLSTEGIKRLDLTLWVYVLVVLTTLFAVNTFVCTADKVFSVFRNKKPWQALFPHIVHVGFLVALLGHLAGSVWGFRSFGNVVFQGQLAPVPFQDGLFVRLDDMEIKPSETGELESLNTRVTLLKDGKEIKKGDITINGPLIYKGIAFYHVDQGQTPSGLVLRIGTDEIRAALNEPFSTSDGAAYRFGPVYPDFAIDEQGRPYSRSSEFVNPFITIVGPDGAAGYLDVSRPGTEAVAGGKNISLIDYVYSPYAVFTINKDPGIGFIIAGSIILVGGMVLLLFFRGERAELIRQRKDRENPA